MVNQKTFCCQTDVTLNLDFDLLQKYRRTEKFCDLYIQSTVNDSKAIIPCHKIVLSSISPFFSGKLESQDTGTIYLDGIDESTLQSLIDYIYSGGQINLTTDNVYEIFAGAQELRLNKLQDKCVEFIRRKLSAKKVIKAYIFAQSYFYEELSNSCIKFIAKHFKDVKPHGFFNLDAVRVKLIVEHQIKFRSPAEDILEAVIEWLHTDKENRVEYASYLIRDIPLVEIDVTILRKLLREDNFMRSIKVVYNLYVDAVEEILMRPKGRNKSKIKAEYFTCKSEKGGKRQIALCDSKDAGRSKRRRSDASLKPNHKKIILSDLHYNNKRKENIVSQNSNTRVDVKCSLMNKPLVYFVSQGLIDSERKSLVAFNLESKQIDNLTAHFDFDGLNSLVYHNGNIYSLGGIEVEDSVRYNLVSVFDFHNKTWKNIGRNERIRAGFKSILLGEYIYTVGGASLKGTVNDVERFPLSHSSQKWSSVAKMLFPRYDFGVGAVNGRIYAVGGWAWNKKSEVMLSISNTMECYDPARDEWSVKRAMPNGRRGLAVVAAGQFLYAIGGGDLHGQITETVDIYDIFLDNWQSGVPMLKKRQYFSAVYCKNCIYVIGGDSADCPTMEIFDIQQQAWEDLGPMPSNGFYHSVEIHTDITDTIKKRDRP